jgi:hypothetical protein
MEFIIYIVIGLVGVIAGWQARGMLFRAIISEEPERIMATLQKIKEINDREKSNPGADQIKSGVEVEPECVNSTWYAYAKETGQFLGQGSTLEAALTMAATRFPTKTFWCSSSDEPSQTA